MTAKRWFCTLLLVLAAPSGLAGSAEMAQVVDGWWHPPRDYTLLDLRTNSAELPRFRDGTAGRVKLHFDESALMTNRLVMKLSTAGAPPVTLEILRTCDVTVKPSGTNSSFRFDVGPPETFSGGLKVDIMMDGRRCFELAADEVTITRIQGAVSQRSLSAAEAAELAARLANDRCEKQYRKRPFRAEQHPAVLKNGTYHWGGLDVGGPGGYSALVTFSQDGSQAHVEVYFSTDVLSPMR